MFKFEVLPGDSIQYVANKVVEIAKAKGLEVSFVFNDIEITTTPSDTEKSVVEYYEKQVDERYKEYLKSDRYKKHQEELTEERAAAQLKYNKLISEDVLSKSTKERLIWLKDITDASDFIGVKTSLKDFTSILEACGYFKSQHVGKPKEYFENPVTMLEYLAGQALSFAEQGMFPHQMTINFCNEALDKL